MGKVGSSTIYKTLKKELPFSKVFHVHFLSDYWLKEKLPKTNHTLNIDHGNRIRKYLSENSDKKVYLISMIREPVGREISNIFENPQDFVGNNLDKTSAMNTLIGMSEDEILNIGSKISYEYYMNWFSSEFESFTGIDIYKYPFEKSKGYQIFKDDNYNVLLIKLESLNDVYQNAFNEFLELKITSRKEVNIGNDKISKGANSFLKNNLKYSIAELNNLYDSNIIKHFYSEDQIQKFKQKWSNEKSLKIC